MNIFLKRSQTLYQIVVHMNATVNGEGIALFFLLKRTIGFN